jgi:hypothetical protein
MPVLDYQELAKKSCEAQGLTLAIRDDAQRLAIRAVLAGTVARVQQCSAKR